MVGLKNILKYIFLLSIVIGMSSMDSKGVGLFIAILLFFGGFIGIFIIENFIYIPRHHEKQNKKVA
jgi:uncharacterized membrane-anchored protein